MASHEDSRPQDLNSWAGWSSMQDLQGRSSAVLPSAYGNSSAMYGQDYSTLVRPAAQYRQNEDNRRLYEADDHGALSAAAWQQDHRPASAINEMWNVPETRSSAYNLGSDPGLSRWQQQLAHLQQSSSMDQQSQMQQGWGFQVNAAFQQQQQQQQQLQQQQRHQQQQQQSQVLQIVRKPSSGDQLVQDLRAQWSSMASPPHPQQSLLNAQMPQGLAAPSGSGFENMWGLSTVPVMGGQRGVPPTQASAVPDPRFSDDSATLLDFPDWDGPVLGGASLDDMIMNSIGMSVPATGAPVDPLLPQGPDGGTQQPPENRQAVQRGAGKKKSKSGKKSSSKAAALGLNGQAEDPPVEFLVASSEGFDETRTVTQGRWTPPVKVITVEPANLPLPVTALLKLKQPVPANDSSLRILKWTFAEHMPAAWVST